MSMQRPKKPDRRNPLPLLLLLVLAVIAWYYWGNLRQYLPSFAKVKKTVANVVETVQEKDELTLLREQLVIEQAEMTKLSAQATKAQLELGRLNEQLDEVEKGLVKREEEVKSLQNKIE